MHSFEQCCVLSRRMSGGVVEGDMLQVSACLRAGREESARRVLKVSEENEVDGNVLAHLRGRSPP